jgi:hypothetical protein
MQSTASRRRTKVAEVKAEGKKEEEGKVVEETDWVKYSFFFVVFFLFLTLVFCSIIFSLLRLAYSAGDALEILHAYAESALNTFMAKVEAFEGTVRAAQRV